MGSRTNCERTLLSTKHYDLTKHQSFVWLLVVVEWKKQLYGARIANRFSRQPGTECTRRYVCGHGCRGPTHLRNPLQKNGDYPNGQRLRPGQPKFCSLRV